MILSGDKETAFQKWTQHNKERHSTRKGQFWKWFGSNWGEHKWRDSMKGRFGAGNEGPWITCQIIGTLLGK